MLPGERRPGAPGLRLGAGAGTARGLLPPGRTGAGPGGAGGAPIAAMRAPAAAAIGGSVLQRNLHYARARLREGGVPMVVKRGAAKAGRLVRQRLDR